MGVRRLENSLGTAFRNSSVVFILLLAASLCLLVSPLLVLVTIVAGVLLWMICRHPTTALGAVLAFMPIDFMMVAVGKFFGFPHMTLVSVCSKEIPLLLIAAFLWRRNGLKSTAPDWLLLGCFSLATLRTIFDGSLLALWTDFNFLFPYFIGRVAVLGQEQEQLWARCAVWIAAILSILGLVEVFVFGEGPRTLLYLAVDSGGTEGGALTASFRGEGFAGMREAATMVGPNAFGALCMIALIVWWVYCRNALPACMVATGLICSLTRSAWIGTAVSIPLLAVAMQQKKRLFLYATLALTLFAASIPIFGLSDYLFLSQKGQDLSTEWHREGIVNGLKYDLEHPLGSGNGKLNPIVLNEDTTVTIFETTYPYFAAEYGIATGLCFVGFLFSALYVVWGTRSRLGYMAAGILVGISVVMIFTIPLDDRRLACWVFFPVGLAVRARSGKEVQTE
jgi:hypothetical protein